MASRQSASSVSLATGAALSRGPFRSPGNAYSRLRRPGLREARSREKCQERETAMLDSAQRAAAAELLWAAERDRKPIGPLTQAYPGIDATDAYEIQLANIRRRLAAGARVRGHKVGLSSPVMQQMMGVDEPDYGHLLEDMVLPQDAPIRADWYCYPRIEVEIGYVLGSSL